MTKYRISILLSLLSIGSYAQIGNEGEMYVSPGTLVSCVFDFSNLENGELLNDGSMYYFGNLTNSGHYDFDSSVKNSYTFFDRSGLNDKLQVIEGNEPIFFNNVIFNNPKKDQAFLASGSLYFLGTASFDKGIVNLLNDDTKIVFADKSTSIKQSDLSYVDGRVIKQGNTFFEYPIGNQNYYRPAFVSGTKKIKESVSAKYIYKDHNFFNEHTSISGIIDKLNTEEYWFVKDESTLSDSFLLGLSWDSRTTPKELLRDPENELHIVRWDENAKIWVDEGGIADLSAKTITTPTKVSGYGFFTLATVKKDWLNEGGVVIYNLVTPNGDGKNDYFLIENINKYPNNRVEIFNRWGIKVFETSSYDSNGDGSFNVFNGYSNGRVTVDKGKKLPSGTYYYVVTYEYKDSSGSRLVKKAANLHLETN